MPHRKGCYCFQQTPYSYGRLPKDVVYGELSTEAKARGRPLLLFKDVAKRDLKAMQIDVDNWERLAEDCAKWRCLLHVRSAGVDGDWLQLLARRRQRAVLASSEM